MPRAVDRYPQQRGVGASLYNPNRSGIVSYSDPSAAIDDTAQESGTQIRDGIPGTIYALTGIDVSSWDAFLASLHDGKGIDLPTINLDLSGLLTNLLMAPATVIGSIGQLVMDGVTTVQGFLNGLWEGFTGGTASTAKSAGHVKTAASAVNSTANTAKTNADTAIGNTTTMAAGAWDGWYTTGGTGAPADLQTVVAAIKTTIAGGWTVEVLTTSGTWTRPAPVANILDFWAIPIGSGSGGGKGNAGSGSPAVGGGGPGGGYCAQQINPADLPSTVVCNVAAGGAGSTSAVGAAPNNGGISSFGSLATSNVTTPAIASLFGYYDATSSAPGKGGDGGTAPSSGSATAGSAGGSTPLAAGGAAGSGGGPASSGGDGGNGAAASLTGQTRCGGGGGGGGGGGKGSFQHGGKGGNGGFPGGGGGGGGAGQGTGTTGGNGGNGGNGAIILLYRLKV